MTIKEGIEKIKTELEYNMNLLDESERLEILDNIVSIEDYVFTSPIGSILIIYKGSSFGENQSHNVTRQTRTAEIGLILVINKHALKTKSIEDYIELILNSVTGMCIDDYMPSYLVSDEWIREEKGVWWYAVTVAFQLNFYNYNTRI
jgi:hypothetical protein